MKCATHRRGNAETNPKATGTLCSVVSSRNSDAHRTSVGVGPAQSSSIKMVFWAATISHRSSSLAITQTGLPSGCPSKGSPRSEEHTSELQSRQHLVCRLLLEKKL